MRAKTAVSSMLLTWVLVQPALAQEQRQDAPPQPPAASTPESAPTPAAPQASEQPKADAPLRTTEEAKPAEPKAADEPKKADAAPATAPSQPVAVEQAKPAEAVKSPESVASPSTPAPAEPAAADTKAAAQPAPSVAPVQPVAEHVKPAEEPRKPETAATPPASPAPAAGDAKAAAPSAPAAVSAPATPAAPQVAAPAAAPPPAHPLAEALRRQLAAPLPKSADADLRKEMTALGTFYAGRADEPLWVSPSGVTARGEALVAEIQRAADWGLNPRDFDTSLPRSNSEAGTEAHKGHLAEVEVKLSLAALKYARYARGGRITDPATQLSSYLDRKPQLKTPAAVLAELASADGPDAVLRAQHPRHPQFEKLRQQYLKQHTAAPPPEKVPDGPSLQPGTQHPHVAILRRRLAVAVPEVDGKPGDPAFYDTALVEAVRVFQAKRGLTPADGIVGKGTRKALNQVETGSPKRLLANMEQWRWMPDELGKTYVWVNIPEFTIRVVKDGTIVHSERVITGKTDTQTPIFSDKMEMVVFQPNWNVPESIKVKELWPGLARGTSSLDRHGLRIQSNGRDINASSIDWTKADIRNMHVYQPPGPTNVLGVVKFLFPNKHQVYMHDTPTKHLFNEQSRTFSHGCMRVRNPVRLAEIVMGEDKGWRPEKIAETIKSGPPNNEVKLDKSIPVHVTYFTASVDENGEAQFRRDIYGHEQRVSLALEGKWGQIAKGPDHLAPVKAEPIARLAESQQTSSSTPLGTFFKQLFGGF